MTALGELKSRLAGAAAAEGARYASGQERPLRGYVITMGTYASLVGAIAAAVKLTGRPLPDRLPATDIVLSAAATNKLSRLLARDPVTSPLRAPFTSYRGVQGPAELAEDARGHGARKTVGELVTCPFCLSMWVATGFTAGLILAPRTTRLVMGTLTALAGADLLQYAHALPEKAAD
jgi:Protein of unknown function (DUF1360)